jgi:hypothetical protein
MLQSQSPAWGYAPVLLHVLYCWMCSQHAAKHMYADGVALVLLCSACEGPTAQALSTAAAQATGGCGGVATALSGELTVVHCLPLARASPHASTQCDTECIAVPTGAAHILQWPTWFWCEMASLRRSLEGSHYRHARYPCCARVCSTTAAAAAAADCRCIGHC